MPDLSKQRYNALNYKQIKVAVDPDVAIDFKAACAEADVSMAGVLSEFMVKYSKTPIKKILSDDPFSTRRKRRHIVKNIISQMEQLLFAEERYVDSVPENLQGSKWHELAVESISVIQEVIDLLNEIY